MSKFISARVLVPMVALVILITASLICGHTTTKRPEETAEGSVSTISVEPTIAPTDVVEIEAEPTSTLSPLPTPAPLSDRRIAFTSDRDGDANIYAMNADGTNQHSLTDDPAWDWSPAWSPDGHLIAFYSGRDNNSEVYVMNADGSNPRNLSQHPRMEVWRHCQSPPAWSPDGRLAFYSDREDQGLYQHIYNIYIVDADGSNLRKLGEGMAPVWSPDGRLIMFACADNLKTWEICEMNADGSNRRILFNTYKTDPCRRDAVWSPDGRSIVLNDYTDGNLEIYVMNADGSNQRNLTENPGRDKDPTWSPDGRFIAFTSDRDGNWEIYVMNADGSDQRNLTQHPADDTAPAWSP